MPATGKSTSSSLISGSMSSPRGRGRAAVAVAVAAAAVAVAVGEALRGGRAAAALAVVVVLRFCWPPCWRLVAARSPCWRSPAVTAAVAGCGPAWARRPAAVVGGLAARLGGRRRRGLGRSAWRRSALAAGGCAAVAASRSAVAAVRRGRAGERRRGVGSVSALVTRRGACARRRAPRWLDRRCGSRGRSSARAGRVGIRSMVFSSVWFSLMASTRSPLRSFDAPAMPSCGESLELGKLEGAQIGAGV